ncbi:MAG: hypothetical protein AB9836_12190 [Aminipila sp.]
MSVCPNCKKLDETVTVLQQEPGVCESIVHETVCVQGTVTITPSVVSGTSTSFCVGNPIIGSCPGELQRTCEFTVSQNICVQIPLTFSATASAVENGLVCSTPDIGECEGTTACTHTIGFYRNHPEVTNELITNAGGSIILGINSNGLSFTVTTANANDVLSLNTPAPPAPANPPFANQYQNLYAQLLAANLNVLALEEQGVEVCTFALQAISAANTFLANSPVGGTAGAPGFQEPLERFNSGEAPGCPVHCL